jgi:hypothetical protein
MFITDILGVTFPQAAPWLEVAYWVSQIQLALIVFGSAWIRLLPMNALFWSKLQFQVHLNLQQMRRQVSFKSPPRLSRNLISHPPGGSQLPRQFPDTRGPPFFRMVPKNGLYCLFRSNGDVFLIPASH